MEVMKSAARKARAVKSRFKQKMLQFTFRNQPPCLIYLMDGGIASQLYQYVCGQVLIDRGYAVQYDCLFYEDNGMDLLQQHPREYALEKVCDVQRMQMADRKLVEYYKSCCLNQANQPPNPNTVPLEQDWKMPLYMGNYYQAAPENYVEYFRRYIRLKAPEQVLDSRRQQVFARICAEDSVGVHVRRGDMMLLTGDRTPTERYFRKALSHPAVAGKKFFIFSDDMPWVKERLLPLIPDVAYELVEDEEPGKDYMDFYLLCHCKSQIISQGAFGYIAFLVNPHPGKCILLPDTSSEARRIALKQEQAFYISV